MMATRSRAVASESSRTHTCVLVLIVCSTRSESAGGSTLSLIGSAIIYFLSLYHLAVAALAAGSNEAAVAVSSRTTREHAVLQLTVVLLFSVVRRG